VVFAKQIERQLNADSITEKKKKFPNSQQLRRHVALPNVAMQLPNHGVSHNMGITRPDKLIGNWYVFDLKI
jgi:hypothetical protein